MLSRAISIYQDLGYDHNWDGAMKLMEAAPETFD